MLAIIALVLPGSVSRGSRPAQHAAFKRQRVAHLGSRAASPSTTSATVTACARRGVTASAHRTRIRIVASIYVSIAWKCERWPRPLRPRRPSRYTLRPSPSQPSTKQPISTIHSSASGTVSASVYHHHFSISLSISAHAVVSPFFVWFCAVPCHASYHEDDPPSTPRSDRLKCIRSKPRSCIRTCSYSYIPTSHSPSFLSTLLHVHPAPHLHVHPYGTRIPLRLVSEVAQKLPSCTPHHLPSALRMFVSI